MEDLEGDGWKLVRPADRVPWDEIDEIDGLLPDVDWFWIGLEQHCVAGCCGLAAFDFSHQAVVWARGDEMDAPSAGWYRVDQPGDSDALVSGFRRAASVLRARGGQPMKSTRLNEVLTGASYADFFDDLAEKLAT